MFFLLFFFIHWMVLQFCPPVRFFVLVKTELRLAYVVIYKVIDSFFYRFAGISTIFGTLRDDDETFFESEQLAGSVRLPMLIMHSPDDALVPYSLGVKLFERLRVLCPVQPRFYKVNDTYGPGHRYIHLDPGVQSAVADFIQSFNKPVPDKRADRIIKKLQTPEEILTHDFSGDETGLGASTETGSTPLTYK